MAYFKMDLDMMFRKTEELRDHAVRCRKLTDDISLLVGSLSDHWQGDDSIVFRQKCGQDLIAGISEEVTDIAEKEYELLLQVYKRTQSLRSELLIEAERLY